MSRLLSRLQVRNRFFFPALASFLGAGLLTMCCLSARVPAAEPSHSESELKDGQARRKTQVELVELPEKHNPSGWDRLAELWTSKDKIQVPNGRIKGVMGQVMPWLKRTLAENFLPTNVDEVGVSVVRDAKSGDVYLISYTQFEYQVSITDTPAAIMVTLNNPRIEKGHVETVVETWRKWIRLFMNKPQRFDSPSRIACWKVPCCFYLSMLDLDPEGKLGREECWWVKAQCV